MTLIVEDGTSVENANSYVSETEYLAWADARFGISRATAPATEEAAAPLILRATDSFEMNRFKGIKTSSSQSLQWPRTGVYIDNIYIESNAVPNEVKLAIYELTYAEEAGKGDLNTIERNVKKKKVASIEVEYSDTAGSRATNIAASRSLRKLLEFGGSNMVMRA